MLYKKSGTFFDVVYQKNKLRFEESELFVAFVALTIVMSVTFG